MKTIECRVTSDGGHGAGGGLFGARASHLSRFTFHVSRHAFTLIELIIVVAIMATLASLTFPILGAVKRNMIRTRTQGGLTQLETVIEAYKDKFGHYPPDNGGYYSTNQLYYELMGTTNTVPGPGGYFMTLDGGTKFVTGNFPSIFPNVSGFINCSQPGNGDEAPTGQTFLRDLKANQFLSVELNSNPNLVYTALGTVLEGPDPYMLSNPSGSQKINPWRYNSSNPVHNPKSFDLWIDVLIAGKTNRICNWSAEPLLVAQPYPLQ